MRKPNAIDSYGAGRLRTAITRTRAIRVVLAVAAVALAASAAASARGLDVHGRGLLPTGTTGVIIVDLSLSIGAANYDDVRAALRRVVAANEPIGLVVFSDAPYEMLPPGTPARELQAILRLLAPARGTGRNANPWAQQGFRAGTRISESLQLAHRMLVRDNVEPGSILLLSDLETAPDDIDPLGRALQRLAGDGIRVRVVPLAASGESLTFFRRMLGADAVTDPETLRGDLPSGASGIEGGTPLLLLILGGSCLVALALHERYASRLSLPRRTAEGAA